MEPTDRLIAWLQALAMVGIPLFLIAGSLWAARRILERVAPRARVLLGVLFCLVPLAVGAYCARLDLENAHRRPGTTTFSLVLGAVMLVSLLFLVRARTRSLSAFGAVGIALATTAFWFTGPLWVKFAPPLGMFREGNVVHDVRVVLYSQVAYAASNDGAYGRLPCLAAPIACGFPAGTTPFLDARNTSLQTRDGYRRSFIPGAAKPGTFDAKGLSSFAYLAIPLEHGKTGIRAFCGDDTGRICATSDGSVPLVVGGRCPQSCPELK